MEFKPNTILVVITDSKRSVFGQVEFDPELLAIQENRARFLEQEAAPGVVAAAQKFASLDVV